MINLTSDTGSSQVHYNNSNITIDNENNRMNQFLVNSQAQITPTSMEMYGGNLVASSNKNNILLYGEPNQINGIDTYSYSAMKTANRYSDMTTMNVWFYGDIAEEEFSFDKIKIEKEWNDENNRDHLRPESVFVNLYSNGEAVAGNPYEITSSNDWTITFKVLKKINEEKLYSIEEIISE